MIRIEADFSELLQLIGRIEGLRIALERPAPLLDAVGETVQEQTQIRIRDEKRDPDGRAWKPWSSSYAATRGPQHSLLIDTRSMHDNIKHKTQTRDTVRIWADTIYSGHVDDIRQFVGLSDANANEVESLLVAFVRDALYGTPL